MLRLKLSNSLIKSIIEFWFRHWQVSVDGTLAESGRIREKQLTLRVGVLEHDLVSTIFYLWFVLGEEMISSILYSNYNSIFTFYSIFNWSIQYRNCDPDPARCNLKTKFNIIRKSWRFTNILSSFKHTIY